MTLEISPSEVYSGSRQAKLQHELAVTTADLGAVDLDDVKGLIERMTAAPDWFGSKSAEAIYSEREAQARNTANSSLLKSYSLAEQIVRRAMAEFNGEIAAEDRLGGDSGMPYHRAIEIFEGLQKMLPQHQPANKLNKGWMN